MPGAESRLVRRLAAVGRALALCVYDHLQLIGACMQELGLEFQRSFALGSDAARATVDAILCVAFHDRHACSWSSPMPVVALDSCR
jgi:hypothetical protein